MAHQHHRVQCTAVRLVDAQDIASSKSACRSYSTSVGSSSPPPSQGRPVFKASCVALAAGFGLAVLGLAGIVRSAPPFQEAASVSNLLDLFQRHSLADDARAEISITGDYDNSAAGGVYAWDIVEPYRTSTFSVDSDSGISEALNSHELVWEIVNSENNAVVHRNAGSLSATFTFEEPGKLYHVRLRRVRDANADAKVGWMMSPKTEEEPLATVDVMCRYVRRELRRLREEDRDRFLTALQKMYTVSQSDGEAKYGQDFLNMRVLSKEHSAFSSTEGGCTPYHFNMAFYGTHAAFIRKVEKVLQLIDKTVSMHYWDFIIDAESYGSFWAEKSPIFKDDWFGSADPGEDANYIVTSGRWGSTPKGVVDDLFHSAEKNAFGVVGPKWNQNPTKFMQRSQSVCGLSQLGISELPHCELLESSIASIFDEDGDKRLSSVIVEASADIHGWCHMSIGGAFNCGRVNIAEKLKEHPKWGGFVEGLVTGPLWNVWSNAYLSGVVTCPETCENLEQGEPCRCFPGQYDTSNLSYKEAEEILTRAKFYDDVNAVEWAGIVAGDDKKEATIWAAQLTLSVGNLGSFATPYSSTEDPLFWPLHAFVVKVVDTVRINPKYRPEMNMSWSTEYGGYAVFPEDRVCDGVTGDYATLFTPADLGLDLVAGVASARAHGDVEESNSLSKLIAESHLTNAQLLYVMNIEYSFVDYVYDHGVNGVCAESGGGLTFD